MAAPGQPFGLRDVALRRCLLAVTVLHDLDLSWDQTPNDVDGVPDLWIDGATPIHVPADRLRDLLDGRDPERAETVRRVARWLLLRRELQHVPPALIVDAVRVVGLPAEHVTHPGDDWIRARVPGGAVTLGLGLLPHVTLGGEPAPADTAPLAVPLPAGLLDEVGLDPESVWPAALARLEELGGLAAARRRRRPRDPLKPLAEADVVTLLASRRLRFQLATESATGMAGLVVPMLTRGWVSNSSIDSAFGPAAAAATAEEERGFPRPLLVTEYEVVQVPGGGNPLRYLGVQQARSPFG
jgi:hypothetical protein